MTQTIQPDPQAAQILNTICTRDELEDIIRKRGFGFYGRLLKWEMAQVVAGVSPQEFFNTERARQQRYLANRKASNQSPEDHA